jgi:hypothetical protein
MSKLNSDCLKTLKREIKAKTHTSQQTRKQHHHYHGSSTNIRDDIRESRTVNNTNDDNSEKSVLSSSKKICETTILHPISSHDLDGRPRRCSPMRAVFSASVWFQILFVVVLFK